MPITTEWVNGAGIIRIDSRELDKLIQECNPRLEKVLKKTGLQIEAKAKTFAPVDTGALKSSIHTVMQNFSDFQGVALITSVKKRGKQLQVSQIPKPDNQLVVRVGPGVEYGVYQEYGTSRMAAHPYMTPAAESVIRQLDEDIAKVLSE